MKELIEKLLALQDLQLQDSLSTDDEARVKALRAKIPQPIQDHFDRLIAQGKKGVALVQHGVCSGCHLRICSGTLAALAHPTDIHICDNCGRYLYLIPSPAEETVAAPPPLKKRMRKAKQPTVIQHN